MFLESKCANSIGQGQEVRICSSIRQQMQCNVLKGKDGERGCCQLQGRRGSRAGGGRSAEQSCFSLTSVGGVLQR